MRNKSVWGILALILLGAGACASEPTEEMTAAQAAYDQAVQAEAETYAPDQFAQAKQLLEEAKAAVEAEKERFALVRDFDAAKEKLAQAKADLEAAASAAQQAKEQVRQEAEEGLAAAEQALQEARDLLAKAPRGKGSQADLEAMQADLTAAEEALASARQALEAGKYMDARAQVNGAREKIDAVKQQVEAAIATRRR